MPGSMSAARRCTSSTSGWSVESDSTRAMTRRCSVILRPFLMHKSSSRDGTGMLALRLLLGRCDDYSRPPDRRLITGAAPLAGAAQAEDGGPSVRGRLGAGGVGLFAGATPPGPGADRK